MLNAFKKQALMSLMLQFLPMSPVFFWCQMVDRILGVTKQLFSMTFSTPHSTSPMLQPLRHRCAGTLWVLDFDGLQRGCGACSFDLERARRGRQGLPFGEVPEGRELIELLNKELSRRRKKPEWVLFSPGADPFVPANEAIRAPALELIAALMRQGIGVTVTTRGGLPQGDGLLTLARRFPGRLRVEVGLFSSDRALVDQWERGAATLDARLSFAAGLVNAGADVVGLVGPIIPFINDADDDLRRTLRALAARNVRTVKPLWIEDGPGLVAQVEREISRSRARLLNGWFRMDDGPRSGPRRLPAEARRARYATLLELAEPLGMHVVACRCTTEQSRGTCVVGPKPVRSAGQMDLFGASKPQR